MDETKETDFYRTGSISADGTGIYIYRWVRTLALTGALIWGVYQGIGNNIEYSRGEMTGMINKVSEKGLLWKTYEGQLALEGIVSRDNSVGANVWNFSLDRQARRGEDTQKIVTELQGFMRDGTKVVVAYNQPFAAWPWRSKTRHLIQRVEPAGKAEQQ